MKKAIVFVDANNWYHNLKKFFEPTRTTGPTPEEELQMIKSKAEKCYEKDKLPVAMVNHGNGLLHIHKIDLEAPSGLSFLASIFATGRDSWLGEHPECRFVCELDDYLYRSGRVVTWFS